MVNHGNEQTEFWYRGKLTRRRWLGLSAAAAGALGSGMLVPAPWRDAFGQAKPYKLGMIQPLSSPRLSTCSPRPSSDTCKSSSSASTVPFASA